MVSKKPRGGELVLPVLTGTEREEVEGGASQVERNQLVERLPKVFKAVCSIPSSAHTNHGGACLLSQHLGGRDKRISS